MNIEMNKTKSRSNMSSLNFSRKSSVHSNTSSIDYVERVQAMANNHMCYDLKSLGFRQKNNSCIE